MGFSNFKLSSFRESAVHLQLSRCFLNCFVKRLGPTSLPGGQARGEGIPPPSGWRGGCAGVLQHRTGREVGHPGGSDVGGWVDVQYIALAMHGPMARQPMPFV